VDPSNRIGWYWRMIKYFSFCYINYFYYILVWNIDLLCFSWFDLFTCDDAQRSQDTQ